MKIERSPQKGVSEQRFGVNISTIIDNEFQGLPTTPSFITSREHNSDWPDRDLSHPAEDEFIHKGGPGTSIISGYLYSGGIDGKDLFYSHGRLDRLEKVAEWGDLPGHPDEYIGVMTEEGDIVLVSQAWYTKRNPIVFPANDYSNPVEVKFNSDPPRGATRNQSIAYSKEKGYIISAEYWSGGTDRVWKVTKPFTDPNNWKVVMSKDTDEILHFHSVQYDPFSYHWILSSGDFDDQVKIWVSSDGEDWDLQVEGNQKWRHLNCIFERNFVYWVPDSGGGTGDGAEAHTLYKCPRNPENNVPNFANTIPVVELPYGQPSYGNVYLKDPHGILILPNIDGAYIESNRTIKLLFYSFEDEKVHFLREIKRVDPDANYRFGFRSRGIAMYPNPQENRVVVGFSKEYVNSMDVGLNNIMDCRNLVLEVVRL